MTTDLTQTELAISGATGAVGGRVASRMAGLDHAQRLIVRDARSAPDLLGAEVAEGSYKDPEAIHEALSGTRTFFMVSAGESSDRVRRHIAAVDAAVEAGVERIVYLSFLGAASDATFTFARHHWQTEEHVRSTGLKYTFLRDSAYLDYVPALAGTDGVIRGPAGEGRVGAVARDDVAEVAVAVLLGDGHDGRTYEVTGPEAITLREAAEELSGQWASRQISSGDTRRSVRFARLLRCTRLGGRRVGHYLHCDSEGGDGCGERYGRRAHRPPPDGAGRVLAKVPRELPTSAEHVDPSEQSRS
jgi:uncharacterized protein YbjT (DUF2867 family)